VARDVVVLKLCDIHLRRDSERKEATFSDVLAFGLVRKMLELCEDCIQEPRTLEQWIDVIDSYGSKPEFVESESTTRVYPCREPGCERGPKPYLSASGLRSHMLDKHGHTGTKARSRKAAEFSCTLPDCDHPEPFETAAGLSSHQRSHKARLADTETAEKFRVGA
jgi:hypothetical protein